MAEAERVKGVLERVLARRREALKKKARYLEELRRIREEDYSIMYDEVPVDINRSNTGS